MAIRENTGKGKMDMAMCHKHKGMKLFVLGVLILLNAAYMWVSWGVFIGIVVALAGLMKMSMHACQQDK